jgi:hypothetical protein
MKVPTFPANVRPCGHEWLHEKHPQEGLLTAIEVSILFVGQHSDMQLIWLPERMTTGRHGNFTIFEFAGIALSVGSVKPIRWGESAPLYVLLPCATCGYRLRRGGCMICSHISANIYAPSSRCDMSNLDALSTCANSPVSTGAELAKQSQWCRRGWMQVALAASVTLS